MFDVMTLFKPAGIILQNPQKIEVSFIAVIVSYVLFLVISSALLLLKGLGTFVPSLIALAVRSGLILFVILIHVPLASGVVFLLSRIFSRKGQLTHFVSVNYFFAAASTIFVLVFFVPFAEFAGQILLALGVILYSYFVNEAIEKLFELSPAKAFLLLLVYLAVLVFFVYTAAIGAEMFSVSLI